MQRMYMESDIPSSHQFQPPSYDDAMEYSSEESDFKKGSKPLNVLLLGKTGNGKSSLGCTLLNNYEAFHSDGAGNSVTRECAMQNCRYDDYILSVVDTPGVFDTAMSLEDTFLCIASSMLLSSDGYHVIVLAVKYGNRFTNEEAQAIDHLEKLFGKEILNFAIIVITHADTYFHEKRVRPKSTPEQRDYIYKCEGLNALFKRCGERFFFCNNFAADMENERRKLIAKFQEIVEKNAGRCYTNELFIIAKKALQKEEEARKNEEKMRLEQAKKHQVEIAEKDKDRATLLDCFENMSGSELAKMFKSLSYSERERVMKQVSPAVREKAKKAGACFPKDATCILPSGEVLKMEHLQHGHKVQVVLSDGTLDYQEIFMFGHAESKTESSFLVFTTENQRQLSISPGHYLYVKGQGGKMTMVPARDVQVGDALYTHLPESGTMEFSAVTDIKMKILQGLYNPHTKSGTIIVNGVMASCYTEAFSPVWAHRLLQPVWFLYKMAPWINRIVAKDGMPVWLSFLDIGKSAWEKMGLSAWQ